MAIGENIKLATVADLDAYRRADSDRIGFAISCGEKLTLAKDDLLHGEWLNFLKEIGLPERTANRWRAISGFTVDQVKAFGGIARAATAANISPEQALAGFRETNQRLAAGEKQLGALTRLLVREILRSNGMSDTEVDARIASHDAEIEAGLAKIRAKHDDQKGIDANQI